MESLDIIYSDKHLLACIKPSGIDSESELPTALSEQVGGEFFCLHRLDKPVSGVVLLAKDAQTASKMTAAISGREVKKQYLAVVSGQFDEENGILKDLLFYDRSRAKSFVVKRERKGVKEASLDYSVIQTVSDGNRQYSLVKINLHTGRTHQIRVQFASRRHPVAGDSRYGSEIKLPKIALCSYKLEFSHPFTNQKLSLVSSIPHDYPWSLFSAPISDI